MDTTTPTMTVTVLTVEEGYSIPENYVFAGDENAPATQAAITAKLRELSDLSPFDVADADLSDYMTDADKGENAGGWTISTEEHTIAAPRIDVLVTRDPDGPTHVTVYRDGAPVGDCENDPRATIVRVDPGAGWTAAGWQAAKDDAVTRVHPALVTEVIESYESWGERVEVEGVWGAEADDLRGEVAMFLRDDFPDHADEAGAASSEQVREWITTVGEDSTPPWQTPPPLAHRIAARVILADVIRQSPAVVAAYKHSESYGAHMAEGTAERVERGHWTLASIKTAHLSDRLAGNDGD